MAALFNSDGTPALDPTTGQPLVIADDADPSACACCGNSNCTCDTTTPSTITHWAVTVSNVIIRTPVNADITFSPWAYNSSPGSANGTFTISSLTGLGYSGAPCIGVLDYAAKNYDVSLNAYIELEFSVGGTPSITIQPPETGQEPFIVFQSSSGKVSCGGSVTFTNDLISSSFAPQRPPGETPIPCWGYGGTVTVTPVS